MSTTAKVSHADIAEAAGVHRNNVGPILSGKYRGSQETIDRVKAVALELGYGWDSAHQEVKYPEGVRITEANPKMTPHHTHTLEFQIEVACEWEWPDDAGPMEEGKVVDTEMKTFSRCLDAYPDPQEVMRIIAAEKLREPEAV